MEACDIALELEAAKHRILVAPQACAPLALTTPQSYVESRMTSVAPNLSALVGTNVAAKLMAAAGGLAALSKLPACTVVRTAVWALKSRLLTLLQLILGTKKKVLAGMSTATAMSRVGFVAESNMMLKTPPDLRTRCVCSMGCRFSAFFYCSVPAVCCLANARWLRASMPTNKTRLAPSASGFSTRSMRKYPSGKRRRLARRKRR